MIQLFVLILSAVCSSVFSDGFYKVIAPKTIRPWSSYRFAIEFDHINASVIVQCYLIQNGTRNIHEVKDLILPYESRIFQFLVQDLPNANYELEVSSKSNHFKFRTRTRLMVLQKSYFVFVQMDKSVYKPGDKVRFQLLALDTENLRPLVSKMTTISVLDGNGNKVKKWSSILVQKGILAMEFQLSDELALGHWTISIEIDKQVYTKQFLIALHIYPNFIVDINVPKHILFLDKKLIVGVNAKHFYGMNIAGNVTVAIYPTIRSGVIQPIFQNPARKLQSLVDGKAVFSFDISDDLKLKNEYERTVIVDVIVEEAFTNRKQNNSAIVQIFKHKYRLELIKTAYRYKPGFNYTSFLRLVNMDGTLVQSDSNQKITIKHNFGASLSEPITNQYLFPKSGILQLNFTTPRNITNDETQYLQIEAYYQDLKMWFEPILPIYSSSRTYLQIQLVSEKLQLNSDAEFMIMSSENFDYINYEIVNEQNGVILSKKIVLKQPRNSTRLLLEVEPTWRPIVFLLVNYIRPDGEFISDSLRLQIYDFIPKKLMITSRTNNYNSGDKVEFSVQGESNTAVSFVAVDNRSSKDSNMLNFDDFSLNKNLPYPSNVIESVPFFWHTLKSNFEESGIHLVSNADIIEESIDNNNLFSRQSTIYGSSTLKPDLGPPIVLHTGTRPPLAGPYAFSRIPKPILNEPRVYLTENYESTWFFKNLTTDYNGIAVDVEKLPKMTLNNWRAQAVSIGPHGLDVSSPFVIQLRQQPFDVFTNIPYSVRRGEIISIPVIIKNNQDQSIIVEILIQNSEQNIEFVSENQANFELFQKRKLNVPANSHGTVAFFMIRAIKLGLINIDIEVTQISDDVIIKKVTETLNVEAEGLTQYQNYRFLVNFNEFNTLQRNVSFNLPEYYIPDSMIVEIAASGDIFAAIYKNLNNIVPLLPKHGSCDLAMLNFVPNIVVADHLSKSNKLSTSMHEKLISNLELGLQQVLRYRLNSGAFSVFYRENEPGSIWITSMVMFWLLKAQKYVYIDEKIVENGLSWLKSKQNSNGGFFETGTVIHRNLQESNIALTSFVLLTFIERDVESRTYETLIELGKEFVRDNVDKESNPLPLAISAYMLSLSDDPVYVRVKNKLLSISKSSDNYKWWSMNADDRNIWKKMPNSIDIETTSFALLALIKSRDLESSVPIFSWLVSQQNKFGGFSSVHDTIIGLYALSKYPAMNQSGTDIAFVFRNNNGNESEVISISDANALVFQTKQLLQVNPDGVAISAEGRGLAVIQVSFTYSTNVTRAWPLFILEPQINKISTESYLRYSNSNLTFNNYSNLALVEVNFPTGFVVDTNSIPGLKVSRKINELKVLNEKSTVLMFYNNVTVEDLCTTISAYRIHDVKNLKPASVVVYDVYNTAIGARTFYENRNIQPYNINKDENNTSKNNFTTSIRDVNSNLQRQTKSLAILPLVNTLQMYCLLMFLQIFLF